MLTLDFKIWIASFRLLISTHEFGPTFMTSCPTFSIKNTGRITFRRGFEAGFKRVL